MFITQPLTKLVNETVDTSHPASKRVELMPNVPVDLGQLTIHELLGLHGEIIRELRRRNVVRSNNTPPGDYAELLVMMALDGKLADKSAKSWDVITPPYGRVQVKSRIVTNPADNGQRQLSALRSWDFDHLAVVLFDGALGIYDAALVPAQAAQHARTYYRAYTNSTVLFADASLMGMTIDPEFANKLRAAAVECDSLVISQT